MTSPTNVPPRAIDLDRTVRTSKARRNRATCSQTRRKRICRISLFALARLVPLVGAAIPAQAAKQNATAARAACFKQANAAAAATGNVFSTRIAERKSAGYAAGRPAFYRHALLWPLAPKEAAKNRCGQKVPQRRPESRTAIRAHQALQREQGSRCRAGALHRL
jgi:hypothetical protein